MTSPFTCGLDAVLFVMGGKWKPLIVYNLAQGTLRYAELRRAVGRVSDKVLAQQLKELIADGIVARRDFGEIPPRVEYSLTPFGKSLAQALVQLCEWGAQHTDALAGIVERRARAE
ncbi:helix-turn-helix domain-containing protein [Oceanicella sp. SM1341]|uniref:winged helix-turn-helix transcriptional regulator n=1 Tax=Oceanicella sp. SM1341 TaxID=1548889 RepID=UPI000E4EBAA4|nr:helix-turn-helix domain-containing protein [Oceanicella sp. SM1341]